MAYEVKKTDGSVIATVQDGQADTSTTSIGFIGRRYSDYGLIYNENQMHLLENFNNSSPPTNPVVGQMWFDSSAGVNLLKVYISDFVGWSPLSFTETFTGAIVKQNVNFQGETTFSDTATFESKSFFKNDVTFQNTEVIFQDTTISGNPTVASPITFTDSATFQGTAIFSGGFQFGGATTFDDTVTFNDAVATNSTAPFTFGATATHNFPIIMDNDSGIQFNLVATEPSSVANASIIYNAPTRGNDGSTVLLCFFAGADGSTTIIDSSAGTLSNGGSNPDNTITAFGDAAIDSFILRHGSGSLKLDGTGDYVSVNDNTNWNFGTADFTIDSWIRVGSTGGIQTIFSKGTSATDRFEMTINAGALEFLFNDGVNSISISGGDVPTNEWVHVALVRSPDGLNARFDLYISGDRVATTTVLSATYDFDAITGDLQIGRRAYGTFEYFNGNMDNFRVTKGTAKYVRGFTPRQSAVTDAPELAYMTDLGFPSYFEFDFGVW